MDSRPPTKKERKELKRQLKLERQSAAGGNSRSSWLFGGLLMLIVAGMIGIFLLGEQGDPGASVRGEVVSQEGVHWDPMLAIIIKGEKQTIPANLGLGGGHNPIHTHDASGQVHFEYSQGPVTKDQLSLSKFFQLWGKTFNSEQILNSRNGDGGKVSMLVNGQPNTEYEKYQIKEKDQIEIRYE